jgi:signal transduction histidine kinase/ActR/RegA family two-component response regulator
MEPPDPAKAALARALEHAPGGVLSFSDEGHIAYANVQMHRLLGVDSPALIGTRLERWLPPASRVFYTTYIFPLLKLQGTVRELSLQLMKASGERMDVIVSITRETTGGAALSHGAVTVLAQRHQLEAALLEARKRAESATLAKDQFLAVISHELRSPLSAIRGWARIGLGERVTAEMRQRALETIERNVVAQTRLIDDLLDVSRIVSGKLRLSPRSMDLAPLVEAAIDNARPAAAAKAIELLAAVDRTPYAVLADPDRTQQVVWNLISNAIKFTPKGGRVQVTLARRHSRLRLEVSDTGLGISSDQLPFVFERFWQGGADNAVHSEGIGLGLSICKSLIELHGGTISALSEGLNLGATFSVELPLAVAAARSAPIPSEHAFEAEVSLAGIHALVVDDDLDTQIQLRILLEAAGARVTTTASCDEALQSLDEVIPDILVSDIGLPGKDGYELIKCLRSDPRSSVHAIPAVAVTGMVGAQDRVNLLRAGFQAHLSKPIDPAEMTALVRSLVRPRP